MTSHTLVAISSQRGDTKVEGETNLREETKLGEKQKLRQDNPFPFHYLTVVNSKQERILGPTVMHRGRMFTLTRMH